jgi:hypothetical protein
MKRWTHLGAALTLSAIASVGYAQQAATAPDPATIVVPEPKCDQPPSNPGLGLTPPEENRYRKRIAAYSKCMQDYALGLESTAKQYAAVAQKYLDVGNKAVNDYNAFMKEVRKNTNQEEDENEAPKAGPAPSRM